MRALLALACVPFAAACQSDHKATCADLDKHAPVGVHLGSNDSECTRILSFAKTVPRRFGMDFKTWLAKVPPQGTVFVSETLSALLAPTSPWTPHSFGPIPAQVPCGQGVPVTDELWSSTPLSKILTKRPDRLYVSLAVEIPPSPGDMVSIKVLQDFDCDHEVGVTELVGEFHRGMPMVGGGWKLMVSKSPAIDE